MDTKIFNYTRKEYDEINETEETKEIEENNSYENCNQFLDDCGNTRNTVLLIKLGFLCLLLFVAIVLIFILIHVSSNT